MKLEGVSQVLRIYVGSNDKCGHEPLYEQIVKEAKKFGIAGASVFRGVLSYGANSVIHSVKIWELSVDLPIVIEIVDTKEKALAFAEVLDELFEKENIGGLITTYEVNVIAHQPHKGGKNGNE